LDDGRNRNKCRPAPGFRWFRSAQEKPPKTLPAGRISTAAGPENVHLRFSGAVLILAPYQGRAAMLRFLAIWAIGLMVSLAIVSSALATIAPP
jgi:hypothetical protein